MRIQLSTTWKKAEKGSQGTLRGLKLDKLPHTFKYSGYMVYTIDLHDLWGCWSPCNFRALKLKIVDLHDLWGCWRPCNLRALKLKTVDLHDLRGYKDTWFGRFLERDLQRKVFAHFAFHNIVKWVKWDFLSNFETLWNWLSSPLCWLKISSVGKHLFFYLSGTFRSPLPFFSFCFFPRKKVNNHIISSFSFLFYKCKTFDYNMTKTPDLFSSGNSWSGIYLIPTLLLGWKTVEKETAWMMTFCPKQSQARLYTKRATKRD